MKRYIKADDNSQHYVIDIVATFEFKEQTIAAAGYIIETKSEAQSTRLLMIF